MKTELQTEVVKQSTAQALPVSVVAGTIMGVQINTLILWLTLIYLIFQIVVIVPKAKDAVRDLRGKKKESC